MMMNIVPAFFTVYIRRDVLLFSKSAGSAPSFSLAMNVEQCASSKSVVAAVVAVLTFSGPSGRIQGWS
jgi:hypothetical protein